MFSSYAVCQVNVSEAVTYLQSTGREKVETYGNYRYNFGLSLITSLYFWYYFYLYVRDWTVWSCLQQTLALFSDIAILGALWICFDWLIEFDCFWFCYCLSQRSFFFIDELDGGALLYWWLDAKRPYLLSSSKPCGPWSSRTEGHHRLSSAR